MNLTTALKTKPTFVALLLLPLFSSFLHGNDSAGFCRLTGDTADTSDWNNAARFSSIAFTPEFEFAGTIQATSGSEVTVSGAFWALDEFKHDAATQPNQYYALITSGTAAGNRYDITSNTGNTLTVDLTGTNLTGVAAADGIAIIAKWTLDHLFPSGQGLTASTSGTVGTQVILPADTNASLAFSPTFLYRSDLGHWINQNDAGTDAGSELIPHGGPIVLVQNSATPITPIISGISATGDPSLSISINYNNPLVTEPEISVEQPVNTSLTDGSSSYDFGSVSTASVTFTIRNEGGVALENLATAFSGAHTADYAASALSTTSLDPGETTTVSVTFTPSQSGTRTATLQIASNDADENPFDIDLTGSALTVTNPTNLLLSTTSGGSVILNWGAVTGAQNYTIYRSGTRNYGDAVAVGNSSTNTYTDSSIAEGVTYSYWVEATNAASSALSSFDILTRWRAPRTPLANQSAKYTGDFDGNGVDDLLIQNQTTGDIGWWLMGTPDGNIESGSALSINPGAQWELVNHADLNEDGAPDLLLRDTTSGQVSVWSTDGNDINLDDTLALESNLANSVWKLAGADDDLLVWQNSESGQVSWQQATGINREKSVYGTSDSQLFATQVNDPNWQVVGVRDFNGDKQPDLLWQNQNTGAINAWLLNSSRQLISAVSVVLQPDNSDWKVRALGDWNGDGKTDLALQNTTDGNIALWLMNQLSPTSIVEPSQQPPSQSWEVRNSEQGN